MKMVNVPKIATNEMLSAVDGMEITFSCGDEDWIGIISSDIAEEIYNCMLDKYLDTCDVPPKGWNCTRGIGHDGPCAAIEEAQ